MFIKLIYLAGPFFNPEQTKVIDEIKGLCDSLELKYYSPKDEFRFRKEDPPEKAKECFDSNLVAMDKTDLMIAVIDGFDAGTVFEMGYFCAKGKRIVAYSNVKGRKLNLMLSQSCIGFANGILELADILVRIDSGEYKTEEFKGEQE